METQEALNELCEEYIVYFLLQQGDISHTKLLSMDIDTGDYPPIAQKPYTLPLNHTQQVHEELVMLEEVGIISLSVSSWMSPIIIVPKKAQPGEQHQKHLCVDYCTLNSLLSPAVKAHSKSQSVLLLSIFTKN